jgi:hypothetical protein
MANYMVGSSTKKRINEEFNVVQCMQMANHNAGLSKRKLNKVRRQKKDVTPTLKTCLI